MQWHGHHGSVLLLCTVFYGDLLDVCIDGFKYCRKFTGELLYFYLFKIFSSILNSFHLTITILQVLGWKKKPLLLLCIARMLFIALICYYHHFYLKFIFGIICKC